MLAEIDAKVDVQKLEEQLMREGVAKFADPQKALLKLIGEKRKSLATQRADSRSRSRRETDIHHAERDAYTSCGSPKRAAI